MSSDDQHDGTGIAPGAAGPGLRSMSRSLPPCPAVPDPGATIPLPHRRDEAHAEGPSLDGAFDDSRIDADVLSREDGALRRWDPIAGSWVCDEVADELSNTYSIGRDGPLDGLAERPGFGFPDWTSTEAPVPERKAVAREQRAPSMLLVISVAALAALVTAVALFVAG